MMQQVSDPKKVQKVATAIGLMPSEQRKSPSLPELDLQTPQPQQPPQQTPQQNPITTEGADQAGSSGQLQPEADLEPPNESSSQNLQAIPAELKYTLSQLSNRSLDPATEFHAQVFDQLLSDAPPESKSELLRVALGLSDSNQKPDVTKSTQAVEKWIDASEMKVQRWIELADSIQGEGSPHAMLTGFLKSLHELSEQWSSLSTQSPLAQGKQPWSSTKFSQSLQLGLDRHLLKDFSDNTPWKSTERLPLARLLSKGTQTAGAFAAKEISLNDIPTLSLQQLMSQTDTLRGQCFRVQGTIGLVEPPATLRLANDYSVNYDVLWLRTDDPSGQPIQIYAPISTGQSDSAPGKTETADRWKKDQSITVAGFIAKRRAYASGRGGDIAPVLIAAHIRATDIQIDNNPPRLAYADSPSNSSASSTSSASITTQDTNAPKSAANTTAPDPLPPFSIPYELAKLRTLRDWLPPVDWQVPLNLLQSRLENRLASLPPQLHTTAQLPLSTESPTESPAESPTETETKTEAAHSNILALIDPNVASPDLLASLAVATKFRNEIRQIVSSNCFTLLASPSPAPDTAHTSKVLGEWSGRVTAIRKIPVDTTLMPGLGWSSIYALHIERANSTNRSQALIALVPDVPQMWKSSEILVQPVKIQGLGVFHADRPPKEFLPGYVLASRVLWTNALTSTPPCAPTTQPKAKTEPDSTLDSTSPQLSIGWRSLAASEWDLAHCDSLERLHGTPINSFDAEPLYSLLKITRDHLTSWPTSTVNKAESRNQAGSLSMDSSLSTMDWIRRTEAMKANKQTILDTHRSVGERTRARFQVRRIQRIEVRNPEHQRWLGGNAYYQLDGLASIGENRIAVRYGKDFEPISFEKEFPMTLVSATVPTWVFHDPNPSTDTANQKDPSSSDNDNPKADSPNATDPLPTLVWYPRIRIDVEGWAYRTWRFRTIEVSAATQDTGFQQAPMMIVDQWKLAQGPELTANGSGGTAKNPNARNSMSNILLTIAGLTAIAWFAYRFLQRENKPMRWR
jgi:hypothetical protein